MEDTKFRQPFLMDDNGLYVTVAQMNFFMNGDNGEKLVREVSPEFVRYYNNCKLYNLVYDMMEHDPDCAVMYWDEKEENVSLSFPTNGKVAYTLASIDLYNNFSGGPNFNF